MPLIDSLPPLLEDTDVFIKRRDAAKKRKSLWRSIYQECYRYAMPSRETFSWQTEGSEKHELYDSTLQESTYTAANTLCALLFPAWTRWAELTVGGAIDENEVPPDLAEGLQAATRTFFSFINNSNFATVINEVALDLMIGTGAMSFDEGDNEQPFKFRSVPLSAVEVEEGPDGRIETTFMEREPCARDLPRMYKGLKIGSLSKATQDKVKLNSEDKVKIIQAEVFDPDSGNYYGVVTELEGKKHVWRFNYGKSCPMIVARATKVAGETYGRGRVMLALNDARTLDKMQEFVLRHSAIQISPPATAVSDGVLNPFTAILAPNTIIPVASNDQGNPSLRVLDVGGNFAIGETLITALRERVRRTMIGPEPSEGAVKSATEISINDRNRLWSMNGELSRIQSELLDRIVARGVFILQRKGLVPKFKVDGRQVVVKYHSPFSKSQDSEDLLALERTVGTVAALGPIELVLGLRIEDIPQWTGRKAGLDESLIRGPDERRDLKEMATTIAQQMLAQAQQAGGEAPVG